MKGWILSLPSIYCYLLPLFLLFSSLSLTLGNLIPANEPAQRDSSDIIKEQDAEEIFYNIDIQKYNDLGIRCPRPQAPAGGFLEGGGTRVGTILYARCHSGYSLHGPSILACMPHGDDAAQWRPQAPGNCFEINDGGHGLAGTGDNWQNRNPTKDYSSRTTKGGVSPPFLGPGSQYWETQQKLMSRHLEEEQLNGVVDDSVPVVCRLKPSAGPCRSALRRFYFDPTSMECRIFVYGGCDGNVNNFRTIEECNDACLGLQ